MPKRKLKYSFFKIPFGGHIIGVTHLHRRRSTFNTKGESCHCGRKRVPQSTWAPAMTVIEKVTDEKGREVSLNSPEKIRRYRSHVEDKLFKKRIVGPVNFRVELSPEDEKTWTRLRKEWEDNGGNA